MNNSTSVPPNQLKGILDEFTDHLGKKFSGSIDSIESEVESSINNLLESLDDEEKIKLLKLIQERRKLIDVNPAFKNEVTGISKQILTFGGAGLALGAAFYKEIAALPPIMLKIVGFASLFYFDLVLLSLFTLFIFLWQSRFRYPFLYLQKVGNTKPYFYYRAISEETPYELFQSAKRKLMAIGLFGSDLKEFTEYLISSIKKDPANEQNDKDKYKDQVTTAVLKDELQQYFLLISYQGYINQYEISITHYFMYGMLGSILATIILYILILLVSLY